jgi:MFS family permease
MPRMNGSEPKIEIFKPFGEAFELMKKILFQPFDLRKWLIIGFAAFLASLSGGFTSSFNPLSRWSTREDNKAIAESFHDVWSDGQTEWWVIALIAVGALIILALVLVVAWVSARGRFIFTDCIVRNRAAIVVPWKEFRAEANSFFIFSVLAFLTLITFAVVGILGLALPLILRGHGARPGTAFLTALCLFLFVLACLAFGLVLTLQLMVPVMYRQRCRAVHAFGQTVKLIVDHPGPVLLYMLFFLVLAIAAVVSSCAVTCATCCIAAIPYIGAVILLPIPVTLDAFSLLFLRQFGPNYDVWADFMPPEFLPMLMPTPAPSGTEAAN